MVASSEDGKPQTTSLAVCKPAKQARSVEMSRARMLKNCSIIGISVMLYLCGNNTCRELQSSINIKDGIGTTTQAANSGATIVSMILLPPFIISFIGLKWAMVFSLVFTLPYFVVNFNPEMSIMLTGSIISGLLSTSIWAAKGTYLTRMAERYSCAFGTPLDSTISMFFGIFYAFYYFGYIWGNVLSYMILQPPPDEIIDDGNMSCGLYFCDSDAVDNENFVPPPRRERYILFGAFMGASLVAALLITVFLDPMKQGETLPRKEQLKLVMKTVRTFIRLDQLLVCPMGVFRGILRTFIATEFTKAFITCSLGIHYVGLSMIGFGVVCGVSSFFFGKIVRYTGRFPIFTSALLIHVFVAIVLVLVEPSHNNIAWLYAVPCLIGVCNAAWESQVAGIYGVIFSEDREVSFNLYALTEEVGAMIAYAYSAGLCLQYKYGILIATTVMAYSSYLIAEFHIIRRIKRNSLTLNPN